MSPPAFLIFALLIFVFGTAHSMTVYYRRPCETDDDCEGMLSRKTYCVKEPNYGQLVCQCPHDMWTSDEYTEEIREKLMTECGIGARGKQYTDCTRDSDCVPRNHCGRSYGAFCEG